MKNSIANSLIFISLIFVCVYLYKIDLLKVPDINNYLYLILSSILLLIGLSYQSLVWMSILNYNKLNVKLKDSFNSIGISLLAKYIPGKIWIIIGRADFISNKYTSISKIKTSYLSLQLQLMVILTGLIISGITITFVPQFKNSSYRIGILMAICSLLAVYFYSNSIIKLVNKIFYFFKLNFKLNNLDRSILIRFTPHLLLYWTILTFAFYVFSNSISQNYFTFKAALSFPLAATIGIISILVPGGIGVREGVIASYLSLIGFDLEFAVSLSIYSRIWFLAVELFYFFSSLLYTKFSP